MEFFERTIYMYKDGFSIEKPTMGQLELHTYAKLNCLK